MADFVPETTIYLFQYTRVDNSNQPFFESEGAKMAWYFSHFHIQYNDYSYQRTERQYIRVDGKADELRAYDMLAYQNGAGKWILCGITGVEFINPNCAEIYFEMDSMQTYIESITFQYCFVEREMVQDDWNGAIPSFNNLQPEGLEVGNLCKYSVAGAENLVLASGKVVVFTSLDENAQPNISVRYDILNHLPALANRYDYTMPGQETALAALLDKYVKAGKADAIMGVYYVPDQPWTKTVTIPIDYAAIFNGYKPVNSKCFSSEFFNFVLASWNGEEVQLWPECLNSKTSVDITIRSAFESGSGGAFAFPLSYMAYGNSELESTGRYGVSFPYDTQLAWATSGYYDYASKHIGSMAANVLGAAVSGGAFMASVAGGPLAGAAMGAGLAALSSLGKTVDSKVQPNTGSSMPNTSIMRWATGLRGFDFYAVGPKVDNMKCIDQFFSMYGYRTNRVKIPNVKTRPKWNYIKTAGAVVSGPFDRADKLAIQSILDNGVTFWHVPGASIGDYSDLESNAG